MKSKYLLLLSFAMILLVLPFVNAVDWTDGLVGYYSFNQSSGIYVFDNGTSNLTAGRVGAGDNGSWVDGKFGGGYYFNGSGGELDITYDNYRIDDDLSICFWGKFDVISSDPGIFFQWTGNHLYDFETNGSFRWVTWDPVALIYTDNLTGAGWTHLCVSRDVGGNMNAYVNGVNAGVIASGTPSTYAGNLYIGGSETAGGFPVFYMDELAIFNRTINLTDAEEMYAGQGYPEPEKIVIPIDVSLVTPSNNANVTHEQNTFTCSIDSVVPLFNVSFNLWNSAGNLIYSLVNNTLPISHWCYQESANVSNQTGNDFCSGLDYSGSYNYENQSSTIGNTYDGNIASYSDFSSYYFRWDVNYSKPSSNISGAKWYYKGAQSGGIGTNYTIPSSCWNQDILRLRIIGGNDPIDLGTHQNLTCWDGSTFEVIATKGSINSKRIYEDGIYWAIPQKNLSVQFSKDFPAEDTYEWNCLAYDYTNLFNWSVSNYTITFQANITDYNETFATEVLEQSSYYFNTTINFTSANSNATARLLYNGTYYNADGVFINGTNYTYYKKLNIPYIPNNNFVENRSFYWVFNLSYGTSYHSVNSSGYSQLVHAMRLTNSTTCDNEPFLFYNLTYADELTQLDIPFAENYWNFTLVNPENTTFKRYFFGNWNDSFHNFCANYTTAQHYFAVKSTFSQINFPDFFSRKDPICKFANTSSENRTLYLLSNTSTDYLSFYFNIKDQTQTPINGAYIYFEKKVNDVWEYLGGERADVYGNVVARLIPNSPYRLTIKSPDCVQLKVEEVTLICQSLPCTNDIIISETQNPYQLIEELPLFNWTMQYYNATKSVNMTFIDSGAGVSYVQFITYQRLLSTGDTQVCSNTSYLSSETLSCGIGSRTGSFISYLYVHKTDGSVFTRVYTFETKEPVSNFGKEGLLWAFFVVAVLFFIGIYNPAIAIFMAVLGLVIMAVVGFVALPWLFFVLLGTIAVIIIIKLKS